MRATALLVLALAAVALLPGAAAVDLLPTEARFGADEARLLLRSSSGDVRVVTDPPVRGAGVAPGAAATELDETPLLVDATHVWRGIEGIVEIVLVRDDPRRGVDIIVEDGSNTGVWVEWPSSPRSLPALRPVFLVMVCAVVAGAARRPART